MPKNTQTQTVIKERFEYAEKDKDNVEKRAQELAAHLHFITQKARELCDASEPLLKIAREYNDGEFDTVFDRDEAHKIVRKVRRIAREINSSRNPHEIEYLTSALAQADDNKKSVSYEAPA